MRRVLWVGLFALAVEAAPAKADVGPGPSPSVNRHLPADSPARSGPFRSCGSGMGVGLAGVGAAWGMLWVGTRFSARVSRGANRRGG